MNLGEKHIISMADMNGDHLDVGYTDDSQVSASFLRKNNEPKYQELAKCGGVVSFFQVRVIRKMTEAQFLERMQPQIEMATRIVEKC